MHWLTKMAMKQREHGADQNYLWNNPDKIKKVEEIFEEYKRRKMEKIRIFLSLPLSGRPDDEVQADISMMKTMTLLHNPFGECEIEFVDNINYKPPLDMLKNPVTSNLVYLGQAIKRLATCNAAVFHPDWAMARGCCVEMYTCKQYEIPGYWISDDYQLSPAYVWVGDVIKEAKIDENRTDGK